jgi:hypothetical protein
VIAVSQIELFGRNPYANVRESALVELSKMLGAMDGGKQAYRDVFTAVFESSTRAD